MDQRKACGKVRKCHGDMHLSNICFHEGKIKLFDALDIDILRTVDVFYDFAFIIAGLMKYALNVCAVEAFKAWFKATGDLECLPLLPLYCSMRAYIRGFLASKNLPDLPETD
jgi:hypothetical protein